MISRPSEVTRHGQVEGTSLSTFKEKTTQGEDEGSTASLKVCICPRVGVKLTGEPHALGGVCGFRAAAAGWVGGTAPGQPRRGEKRCHFTELTPGRRSVL